MVGKSSNTSKITCIEHSSAEHPEWFFMHHGVSIADFLIHHPESHLKIRTGVRAEQILREQFSCESMKKE